jgi:hypothetical protein
MRCYQLLGLENSIFRRTAPTRLSVERPLPRPFYMQSSFATQLTVLEDKLHCKLKLSCRTCDAIDHTEELYVADVVMGLTQIYVV